MNIDLNKLSIVDKHLVKSENILKYVSEYEIYCRYINRDVPFNKSIISPFIRSDGHFEKHPSFNLYVHNNKVLFNDFVSGGGDVFKFVQLFFNNITFHEALLQIITDFNLEEYFLIKNHNRKKSNLDFDFEIKDKKATPKLENLIKIIERDWAPHDLKYWGSFGIDLHTLKKYNVKPIKSYQKIPSNYNSFTITYNVGNYAYAYEEEKDEVITYKIYQPFNTDRKWDTNSDNSVLQGWNQLSFAKEDLIITKSLKDVMTINTILNVDAVAVQNEQSRIKPQILEEFNNNYFRIYLLFDNDFNKSENWGQKFANKLISENPELRLINLVIPEHYKSKDISDLYKNHGKATTQGVFNLLMSPDGLPF